MTLYIFFQCQCTLVTCHLLLGRKFMNNFAVSKVEVDVNFMPVWSHAMQMSELRGELTPWVKAVKEREPEHTKMWEKEVEELI